MKKLILKFLILLPVIIMGEGNFKTLHLIDSDYREMAPKMIFDISNDEELKVVIKAVKNSVFSSKNMVKPSETIKVPKKNNQPEVPLYVYRPSNSTKEKLPVIYFIHGGGYVMGSATENSGRLSEMANTNNAAVISVEYRLATQAPFPADISDAYHGLAYVFNNADKLNVDKTRIVIMGESAGGGLAARLGLMTRDKKEFKLAGQILIYPMLDYRTGSSQSPFNNSYAGEFVWTAKSNQYGWKKLRGNRKIPENQMTYYSAAMAKDLKGLPDTYIAVGDLDLFINEDIDYANRLVEAGVPTELHVISGIYHAFEGVNPAADKSIEFIKLRNNAIQRMFKNK